MLVDLEMKTNALRHCEIFDKTPRKCWRGKHGGCTLRGLSSAAKGVKNVFSTERPNLKTRHFHQLRNIFVYDTFRTSQAAYWTRLIEPSAFCGAPAARSA